MTHSRRHTYPHTIDNGAGERITSLRRAPGATGERVEGENVASPGAGPPMHVHHHQVESFTVQQGPMGYQRLGGPEQWAEPGETVASIASTSTRPRRSSGEHADAAAALATWR